MESKALNVRIAILTFAILALELGIIRLVSGQIRVFAYFGNLVLIVAFLGLGIGTGLGKKEKNWLWAALPSLTVLCGILAFAPNLNIHQMKFPDESVSLWGGEGMGASKIPIWGNVCIFIGIVILISTVFIFLGTELGRLFSMVGEKSLSAYIADLAGSLLGILVFSLIMFLNATPPVWMLLGTIPLAYLTRKKWSYALLILILCLAQYCVQGASFSPYNRIDVSPDKRGGWKLSVNRDFHQYMRDFREQNKHELTEADVKSLKHYKYIYDLPFTINPQRGSAVIVGAGTGNDAQAALRNGYKKVVAVDIDPSIVKLGQELHPEQPYSDKRVVPVIEDARAFFRQYNGEKFDAVVYGLLDSHAMSSAMSTLRVDNFVYTEEGIREAWNQVSPSGHLSLSFSVYAGEWIAERLYWTIAKATNTKPIALFHGMQHGMIFIVPKNPKSLPSLKLRGVEQYFPSKDARLIHTTSDDWPYLYVRPGANPWLYFVILGFIVLMALVSIPAVYGIKAATSDFDAPLFFMGAAFLLLETRSVTSLSLLFGSTWLVNSAVFGGILFMALLACIAVQKKIVGGVRIWFPCLLTSTVLLWYFDLSSLNDFSLFWRATIGGLFCAIPLFFAGIVFPILLAKSKNPAASLGCNLLGAVLGGCMEYLSMVIGLRNLVLLALVLYLLSYVFWTLGKRKSARTSLATEDSNKEESPNAEGNS